MLHLLRVVGYRASGAAAYIARRLDVLSDPTERGWAGEYTDEGSLVFTRTL
ncbi:MAG: hypothetical protein HQ483_19710, partial [Rhodospirillales bacterium]|nr:hypothetical protein [Rhodospirillales bacterium]